MIGGPGDADWIFRDRATSHRVSQFASGRVLISLREMIPHAKREEYTQTTTLPVAAANSDGRPIAGGPEMSYHRPLIRGDVLCRPSPPVDRRGTLGRGLMTTCRLNFGNSPGGRLAVPRLHFPVEIIGFT
jgi:hypothetical protein